MDNTGMQFKMGAKTKVNHNEPTHHKPNPKDATVCFTSEACHLKHCAQHQCQSCKFKASKKLSPQCDLLAFTISSTGKVQRSLAKKGSTCCRSGR